MKKLTTAALFLTSLCWSGRVEAQPAAPANPVARLADYQQATAALRDKLPEVAILKLHRMIDGGKLKPDQHGPVLLLLAEALVRAGRAGEALTVCQQEALKESPEARFWQAQAEARMGRWREAEAGFSELGNVRDFLYAAETAFSRAAMLGALGDLERAGRVLAALRQPAGTGTAERAVLWSAELMLAAERPAEAAALLEESAPGGRNTAERQYLQAKIALLSGDGANAEGLFTVLAADESTASARLQQAARLGRAWALRVQGKKDEALPVLRQVVTAVPTPSADVLDRAFQELEVLNDPPTEEIQTFLNALAAGSDPGLKIRSRLALAAALESLAEAAPADAAWAAISRDFADHPLRSSALLRQAQYLIGQKRRAEAQPLLLQLRTLSPSPAVAAWTAWASGQAEYDAKAYRAASGFFKEASAKSPDLPVRAAASYNAALAELQSGNANPAKSLALIDGSPLAEYQMAGAEFHLERALRMASLGQEEAAAGLAAFAENLPDHPRRFDALIALAEVALRSDSPRTDEAVRQLAAAREAAREPWQLERVALLACYVAEAAQGPEALATKGQQFLTDYPQSAAATDLRMKLAQTAYQRENFSGARQLFEAIAEGDPLHPLAEAALFWAGRAALLTMEPTADQQAVVLWEKVVAKGGPLKWQARLQEALLNQRQRKPAAALQLLDELIAPAATPPPDDTTRWQALSVRGEILAAPAMKPEEQSLGLASFDQIIGSPGLPPGWLRQTLVRKGVCLEALKRPDEALEAYYDVLANPPESAPGGGVADDYWFHRAGDKARRLLEGARKYEEAIEIAKKLAKAPGPRGRAAAELVDELALKYGIWTSSP